MRVALIVFLIFHCIVGFSQDLEFLDEKMKSYSTKESSSYSWVKKNCFLDLKFNLPTEIFKPRNMDIIYIKNPSQPYPDTNKFSDRNILFNIAGFGLEPRVNILDKEEYAIGLKAAVHMNFSLYVNSNNSTTITGFFHLNSSMMMYYTKGLGAKYNNINKNGYSVSVGARYLIMPLVGLTRYQNSTYEIAENSEEYLKRTWILPSFQFDHYKLTSKKRIRNISFAIAYFDQSLFGQFNLGLTF